MALMRARTSGDFTFLARACGIPPVEAKRLDDQLLCEVALALGEGMDTKRAFLRNKDGGLGFQSIEITGPATYVASWHACMPAILPRLGLPTASALEAASPWVAKCLPVASSALRAAVGDDSVSIGDEGVAASQHRLAQAPLAAAATQISESLAADCKASAALRSAGGPGAGVWTNAPASPNQHLSDTQFTIAMRTRMHLPLPQCSGQCQHRRRDGSICGADLNAHGFHALCCGVGGWTSRRHDAACAVLAAW